MEEKNKALEQYNTEIQKAREIFVKKNQDYGTSWQVLRSVSVTDQVFIKAKRIRTIQEVGNQKVGDPITDEFIGIINYSVMGIIILDGFKDSLSSQDAIALYDKKLKEIESLHERKNHDYGTAWRDMRIRSMTDLILAKLFRIKEIEDNDGKTIISEGIKSGYQDIVNYAIFCLIHISEGKDPLKD